MNLLRYTSFIILSFTLSYGAVAQKIWLNSDFEKVKRRNAYFSGRIEKTDTGGFVLYVDRLDHTPYAKGYYYKGKSPSKKNRAGKWQYFHSNGKLRSEGEIRGEYLWGPWIWYYANGNVHTRLEYRDSGKTHGIDESYYQSGQLWKSHEYLNGIPNGDAKSYYPNGTVFTIQKILNGKTVDTFYSFFPDGSLAEKSFFNNGKREGESLFYHENGKLSGWEFYRNGYLDTFKFYNDLGDEVTHLVDTSKLRVTDSIFTELPEIKNFYKKIDSSLNYPPLALEYAVQGRVTVFFIVDPQGEITDLQTTNVDFGYGLEKEAIRAVRELIKTVEAPPSHNRKYYHPIVIPIRFQVK